VSADGAQPARFSRRGLPAGHIQVTERADLDPSQANALLAILRQPSDPPPADQICTAEGIVLTYYALVDAHGTAIEPSIPMTGVAVGTDVVAVGRLGSGRRAAGRDILRWDGGKRASWRRGAATSGQQDDRGATD
jgi:hypothetical protein